MAANRLSQSGAAWAQIFEVYNSGTYNNQWMVIDYKQVASGHYVIMYIVHQGKNCLGIIQLNSKDSMIGILNMLG